jgi:hypothetical protein
VGFNKVLDATIQRAGWDYTKVLDATTQGAGEIKQAASVRSSTVLGAID